jgi:glycine/D-amino acid oxidase-like deaminating enzyme
MGNTNVWLAYGHFRNGILLAPLTARRIATEITQEMGALR